MSAPYIYYAKPEQGYVFSLSPHPGQESEYMKMVAFDDYTNIKSTLDRRTELCRDARNALDALLKIRSEETIAIAECVRNEIDDEITKELGDE